MKDLIFEAMLAEAQFRLAEKTITGIGIDEAIHEVMTEMELAEDEVKELTVRSKKSPTIKPVVEDEDEVDMGDLVGSMDDSAGLPSNGIEFDDPDQLDTAVGVLMYKGIAWNNKTRNTIEFNDHTDVEKAQEALGRRWDFIRSSPRVVATIQFDNLEDYNKVLDFIASKRMAVIMSDDELEPDLDQQIAEDDAQHKQASKLAKEAGQPAPEAPAQDHSYRALFKDKAIKPDTLDALSDPSARSIHVVKRCK